MSIFDNRADEWDKKSRRVKLAKEVVSSIIENAKPEKGMKLADFGTGTGLILLGLSEYAADMTGFDTSEGMLSVLDEKSKSAGLDVKTTLFDLDREEFEPESYDMITCSMVTHHLDDPGVLFKKAFKGLKLGGRFCIADLEATEEPFHDNPVDGEVKHEGFDTEKLKDTISGFGFSDVKIYDAAVIKKVRAGANLEFSVFLAVAVK